MEIYYGLRNKETKKVIVCYLMKSGDTLVYSKNDLDRITPYVRGTKEELETILSGGIIENQEHDYKNPLIDEDVLKDIKDGKIEIFEREIQKMEYINNGN